MTSESTIATQIRTALAQHLKRDVSKIHPQDRLREDLGLDSLAMRSGLRHSGAPSTRQ